jgi:hypothetical protein
MFMHCRYDHKYIFIVDCLYRRSREQQVTPIPDPPPYESLEPPPYPGDDESCKSWQQPPPMLPYGSQQSYPASALPHTQPPLTQQPQPQGHAVPVVIVNDDCSTSSVSRALPVETYTTEICFACVVMCCCNCLFGLIAYILACECAVLLVYEHNIYPAEDQNNCILLP